MTSVPLMNKVKNFLAGLPIIGAPLAKGPAWKGDGASAVLRLSADGQVIQESDGAAALLGMAGSMVGRDFVATCAPMLAPKLTQKIDSNGLSALIRSGQAGVCAINVKHADGLIQTLSLRLRADGEERLVLLTDCSDALGALAPNPRDEQVNEDGQSQNLQALADLSHEMKTPLNAIMGFTDVIREETFGPLGHEKYSEYVEDIQTAGSHLMTLTTTILDMAKHEGEGFALKKEMTDVSALARECVSMVRDSAASAGLALSIEALGDLPESYADRAAVRRILINLLSNAIKFTSHGGVTLRLRHDDEHIIAQVIDTGVGMSAQELARLGPRFTETHAKGVRGAGGHGLGLSLCFALAEAHGGSLELSSAPGEGVEATLTLPIADAPVRPVRKGDRNRQQVEEIIVHSQLDRIADYRREIAARKSAA